MLSIRRAIRDVYSTEMFCSSSTVAAIRLLSDGGKNSVGTCVSSPSDTTKTDIIEKTVIRRWCTTQFSDRA